MVEWIKTVLSESLFGSLGIIKSLAIIIFPMMIILQIMTDYKWLEKLSTKTKWITDFLGVSKETLIPLLIGIFVGVSFGAGAIIFAKEKYNLPKKDILLVMWFIIPFHGLIDTPILFWMMGANPFVIIMSRLFIALTGTLALKWLIEKGKFKKLIS